MTMHKIIFSNYDDLQNPYYAGGGARAIHEIAKRLISDFDVRVLTCAYPGAHTEIIDGVTYERIGPKHFGPKVSQLVFQSLLPLAAWNREYDVWIESFTPPFEAGLLPLLTKKPVIGLAHGLPGEDLKEKYKLPFDWLEARGLRAYEHIIVTSEFFKDRILGVATHSSVGVIPNGITMPEEKDLGAEKKYISFIGRIDVHQKGLDLLLEAFSLARRYMSRKLLIAGAGTQGEMQQLRQLTKKFGLGDWVVFTGRVNEAQKARIFQESFFTVVPSRFETFSMVALESLAHGVPLVTFDIPGLGWIPNTAALKLSGFSAEGLCEAMVRLSRRDELRSAMVTSGRELARQYSWEASAAKYKNFINSVLLEAGARKQGFKPAVYGKNH